MGGCVYLPEWYPCYYSASAGKETEFDSPFAISEQSAGKQRRICVVGRAQNVEGGYHGTAVPVDIPYYKDTESGACLLAETAHAGTYGDVLKADRPVYGAPLREAGGDGVGTGDGLPWGDEGALADGGQGEARHLVYGALEHLARPAHRLDDRQDDLHPRQAGVLVAFRDGFT